MFSFKTMIARVNEGWCISVQGSSTQQLHPTSTPAFRVMAAMITPAGSLSLTMILRWGPYIMQYIQTTCHKPPLQLITALGPTWWKTVELFLPSFICQFPHRYGGYTLAIGAWDSRPDALPDTHSITGFRTASPRLVTYKAWQANPLDHCAPKW